MKNRDIKHAVAIVAKYRDRRIKNNRGGYLSRPELAFNECYDALKKLVELDVEQPQGNPPQP